jgi:hypothetical protein
MKKIPLLLLTFFLSSAVSAELKSLWCVDNDVSRANTLYLNADKEYAEMSREQKANEKEYGVNHYFALSYRKFAEEAKLTKTACKNSNWVVAEEFVFDTEILKNNTNSDAQYTVHHSCGAVTGDTIKVEISPLPAKIYFSWNSKSGYPYTFTVERKNLKAGYDEGYPETSPKHKARNYTCELKKIDLSDNLI